MSTKKIVLIIAGIVAVLALIVALFVGGIAFFVFRTIGNSDAANTARTYLRNNETLKQDIGEVMTSRLQAEELAIHHVRDASHGKPIGGFRRGQRPLQALDRSAVAHVRMANVVNIARALETLKDAGVWTVGLAGGAQKRYDRVDYTPPTALVVGAEGKGLRRLVRERCDWLVSIPMEGHVQNLNVSVALGIALFEVVRQRQKGTGGVGEVGS